MKITVNIQVQCVKHAIKEIKPRLSVLCGPTWALSHPVIALILALGASRLGPGSTRSQGDCGPR